MVDIQIMEVLERKLQELRYLDREEIKVERLGDELDKALAESAREVAVERINQQVITLRQVEAALDRITQGDYDQCEDCGGEIGEKRLIAIPWAGKCVECQSKGEIERRDPRKLNANRERTPSMENWGSNECLHAFNKRVKGLGR